jgi:hypothetical protein
LFVSIPSQHDFVTPVCENRVTDILLRERLCFKFALQFSQNIVDEEINSGATAHWDILLSPGRHRQQVKPQLENRA